MTPAFVKKTLERAQALSAPEIFRLASLILLILAFGAQIQISRFGRKMRALEESRRKAADYAAELRSVRQVKAGRSAETKAAMSDMVKAKRTLYETGLALQEEKRLLEKQLEIMTTYLEVDQETSKINLSRGDQVIKDFPFAYSPLLSVGKENIPFSSLCRITAKERFAAPERGKTEKTEAGLQWSPPESGETARDKALGEFVVFTDSPLVFHAPVADAALHNAYPHLCAGLTLYSAKALYDKVFIGNKVLIKAVPARTATEDAMPSPKSKAKPRQPEKKKAAPAAKKQKPLPKSAKTKRAAS